MFDDVRFTKNADPDNYYSGYGTGFDSCSLFSFQNSDWEKMLFLEYAVVHQCILIIRKKIS